MENTNLLFHIENDDYFGTLATVLDLVRQKLILDSQKDEIQTLEAKVNELMELQSDFKIVSKQ